MKLAYRDKVLLTFLVIIVTGFLAYIFAVKPNMESIDTSKSARTSAQTKLDSVNKEVSRLGKVKKDVITYEEKCLSASNTFLKHTPNYDVDRFIQKMLDKNKLTLTKFTLGDPDVIDLPGYSFTPLKLQYPLGGTFDVTDPDGSAQIKEDQTVSSNANMVGSTPKPDNKKSDGKEQGITSLPAVSIELKVTGDVLDLNKFFAGLCAKEQMSVVINEYKMTAKDATKNIVEADIKMTVYFLQPVDIKAEN